MAIAHHEGLSMATKPWNWWNFPPLKALLMKFYFTFVQRLCYCTYGILLYLDCPWTQWTVLQQFLVAKQYYLQCDNSPLEHRIWTRGERSQIYGFSMCKYSFLPYNDTILSNVDIRTHCWCIHNRTITNVDIVSNLKRIKCTTVRKGWVSGMYWHTEH